MTKQHDDIDESDYYRAMLRDPPTTADPAAHLVWVRLMAQVLDAASSWAPHFTTALVAHYRSLDALLPFCRSGEYERAYIDQVPHALNFLRWVLAEKTPTWLKDLARCEVWIACLRSTVPSEHHDQLRELLDVRHQEGRDFVIVSHDVLETLQRLIGYGETSFSRVARLLWHLGVPPVYPVPHGGARPGIVVFISSDDGPAMTYLAAEGD